MKLFVRLLAILTMGGWLVSCALQQHSLQHPPTTVPRLSETHSDYIQSPEGSSIELQCTTYKRLGWGDGSLDLGNPHKYQLLNVDSGLSRIPPLAINRDGDLFIYDVVNKRILRFIPPNEDPQIIILPNDEYVKKSETILQNGLIFGSFAVTQEHIIISYSLREDGGLLHLSYINYEGTIDYDLNLEEWASIALPLPIIQTDQWGGVYFQVGNTFVMQSSKFGVLYITPPPWGEYPELTYIATKPYEPIIIGWDNYLYHVYNTLMSSTYLPSYRRWEITPDPDYWKHPVEEEKISVPEEASKQFIGIDQESNLYILAYRAGKYTVIKTNMEKSQVSIVGIFPQGDLYNMIKSSSISPNGTFFGLSYDDSNPDVLPSVIQCLFPENK